MSSHVINSTMAPIKCLSKEVLLYNRNAEVRSKPDRSPTIQSIYPIVCIWLDRLLLQESWTHQIREIILTVPS